MEGTTTLTEEELKEWTEEFNDNWKQGFLPFNEAELEHILHRSIESFKERILKEYLKNPFKFAKSRFGGLIHEQKNLVNLLERLGIYNKTIIITEKYKVEKSYGVIQGDGRLYNIEGIILFLDENGYNTIYNIEEKDINILADAMKEIRIWEEQH